MSYAYTLPVTALLGDRISLLEWSLRPGYRSLQNKNNQIKEKVSKIDQIKGCASKVDQLQCMRISVDRFFKQTFIWSIFQTRNFTESIFDRCTRDEALVIHFVSDGAIKCIVAYGETLGTRWRCPWFCTLNAPLLYGISRPVGEVS